MAARTYNYSPAHRALEIAGILGFFAFTLVLGYRLLASASGSGWIVLAVAAFAGFLSADLTSGIVHWAGDTLGTSRTPLLGPNFIKPFRMHHVDEKDITRHDFIETNGNNCLVTMPLLAGMTFLVGTRYDNAWGLFIVGWAVCTSFFVFMTNQFHKWAHMDAPPALIRALQRSRLILSPGHHKIHHTAPHTTYYCITTGWMNWTLTTLRFFRVVEAILSVCGVAIRPEEAQMSSDELTTEPALRG